MNRTFVLIRLSLKQLIWQMARTFGGRKKFSSLLVLLAAAMLIGLSGLYSWAMIESVPAELNMLIPVSYTHLVRKAIAGEKIAGVKITAQDSSLTFSLDGQSYSIPGQMKTYSDAKGRVNYRYFEADPS